MSEGNSRVSSQSHASRRNRKKKTTTSVVNASDPAVLQSVLERFNLSHLLEAQINDPPTKKRSTLGKLKNTISSTLERVRDAIESDTTLYRNCLFYTADAENNVKRYIQVQFPDAKLSFERCKFKNRSSTAFEQVTRRLRKVFGIPFDMTYITATAEISEYTFRLKDVYLVYQQIQERIVDDE